MTGQEDARNLQGGDRPACSREPREPGNEAEQDEHCQPSVEERRGGPQRGEVDVVVGLVLFGSRGGLVDHRREVLIGVASDDAAGGELLEEGPVTRIEVGDPLCDPRWMIARATQAKPASSATAKTPPPLG